ncbi:hypothetical protein CBS101457_005281 [Exobasidium rhododendri]|nr:hypothetical protein CBS101457_005281 [Exobasidium rhododendri]
MAPRTPSPLLAVLLVTSSSRGASLTFQYPRCPKVEKRYSRVRYHVDDEVNDNEGQQFRLHEDEMNEEYDVTLDISDDEDETEESESDISDSFQDLDDTRSEAEGRLRRGELDVASSAGGTGAGGGKERAGASDQRAKRLRAYQQYLGYDSGILASILAPKRELCHRKFELVIDDLAFIGHPLCVDKAGNWDTDAQQLSRGRNQTRKGEIVDGYTIGSPAEDTRTATLEPVSSSQAPLTMFHLVLVLDRPDPSPHLPSLDLTTWLQIFYDNIAFKMTAALFAEEVRCEYVTKESERLGLLRDRCMDDAQSYSSFLTHSLHTSSLARSLQQVYSSISLSSNAFVTINESIDVHLQLPPILHDPTRMMRIADVETPIDTNDAVYSRGTSAGPVNIDDLIYEEWTRTTGPFLLPWKTLLLLNGQDDVSLGEDADNLSTLDVAAEQGIEAWSKKFTLFLKPTLEGVPTFAELADLLDWSLDDDVYPMVRHLIYYREARVIDVPRIQNYYAISPLFDLSDLTRLSVSWSLRFPTLPPLAAFLATLSSALKPYSTQLPRKDQRNLCLDSLIWLLRHQVVVQMHVRLRLIAGEDAKRKAAITRKAERVKLEEQRQKRINRMAEKERKVQRRKGPTSSTSHLSTHSRSAPADVIGAGEGYERGRSRDRSMSPSQNKLDQRQESHKAVTTSASGLSATRPTPSQLPTSLRNPSIAQLSVPTTIAIPTPLPEEMEELKFERRPVLRSRSPSRMLVLAAERRLNSSSTRGGSGSRPSTPRGRGRTKGHLRDSSGNAEIDGIKDATSSQEANQAKGASQSRQREAKGKTNSRSPSRARMRITGFGEGEEVHHMAEGKTSSQDSSLHRRAEEERRLSLVGEERDERAMPASTATKLPKPVKAATTVEDYSSANDVEDESDPDDDEEAYLGEESILDVEAWELTPQSSIIAEPSRAGGDENEWIDAIVEDRPQWLAQRLFKLLPFLNGKHTIDEIVYRLDWRRKDLRAVLVAFKEEILTLVHP